MVRFVVSQRGICAKPTLRVIFVVVIFVLVCWGAMRIALTHSRKRRLIVSRSLVVVVFLALAACGNPTDAKFEILPDFPPLHPDDHHYGYEEEEGTFTQKAEQWPLQAIHMSQAWGTLFADEVAQFVGQSVFPRPTAVAVLDTAIDTAHPDLSDNLVPGYDFTENGGSISVERVPELVTGDQQEHHGTHVAGTIGAATDNGGGIAGIGWNTMRIMPVTVLDETGSGTVSTLIDGLMYAAGLAGADKPSPEQPAEVINLSLGIPEPSLQLEQAVADVRAHGITVVAAAGNAGCDYDILYPAAYPTTIAVGSANPPKAQRADYSHCGDALDLVAPGGNNIQDSDYKAVLSLGSGDSSTSSDTGGVYVELVGTSMATPHVSAVAALLYGVSDTVTPEDIHTILRETATPVSHAGSHPNPEYGWGMLHAERAVRRALMQPYGSYADDGSATVHTSARSTSTRFAADSDDGSPTYQSAQSDSENETGGGRRETPPEHAYHAGRVLLALNADWYNGASPETRRAGLREIAHEYGLRAIRDRGHRFPTGVLPAGQKITPELLGELSSEAEIDTVSYDFYTRGM